jgi:hypothetical protein
MKLLLITMLTVSLTLLVSCKEDPKSLATKCAKSLYSADHDAIKKNFLPEIAAQLVGLGAGQLRQIKKLNISVEKIEKLEKTKLPKDVVHAFIVHAKTSNGKVKKDKIYLVSVDGQLFCTANK